MTTLSILESTVVRVILLIIVLTVTLVPLFLDQRYSLSLRHTNNEHVYNNTLSHAIHKSYLSKEFLDCMVLVSQNLPIAGDGNLRVHHYAAKSSKWNEAIRFLPFEPELDASRLIIDVGGNTHAADSRVFFYNKYRSTIHIYEPVMEFYSSLTREWNNVENVNLHPTGMGSAKRTIVIPSSSLNGQGTFVMEGETEPDDKDIPSGSSVMYIVDAAEEINELLKNESLRQSSKRERIDLLHINCEGCEWELLTRLLEQNMFPLFTNIQMSMHNYASEGIGKHLPVYCLIREGLLKSHTPVYSTPFGWERWSIIME